MPHRMRSRRLHLLLAPLSVAVGLGVLAASASGVGSARPLTSAQCAARVNDTTDTLVPCIQKADLWKYMQAFQAIADDNLSPADGHPSRNSGEPGYKASANYVA